MLVLLGVHLLILHPHKPTRARLFKARVVLILDELLIKPIELNLGPVVQSPISTNPGLTLNKTYRVKPGPGCSKPD